MGAPQQIINYHYITTGWPVNSSAALRRAFRAIGKMTGGQVDKKMVDGMVDAVNGHFFSGLGKVIGGYFSNKSANKKYEELLKGDK